MKLYPVCLRIKNSSCLVAGGGFVALRKVKSLLSCGATVTVVSPCLCKELKKLRQKKAIQHICSEYQNKFLKDVTLAIAATGDSQVNAAVAAGARSQNILINVVDSPELCNFYVPAVIRKKNLLVAIATQGTFPGMAKKLKQECVPIINKYVDELALVLRFREEIKREIKDAGLRKKMIQSLLNEKIISLIKKKAIRRTVDLKKLIAGRKLQAAGCKTGLRRTKNVERRQKTEDRKNS